MKSVSAIAAMSVRSSVTDASAKAARNVLGLFASGMLIQDYRSKLRTEQLSQAREELTREIERTEWRLRVAHLLPKQDLTPELDSIRAGMRRLQGRIPQLYARAQGPSQYALGRGALSLGDLGEARQNLERSWGLGYRRPEVALALGTTLGLLYERSLDTAERVSDRGTRETLRLRAEQQLRDPALEMLEKAQSDLTIPDLLAARIAFYGGDLDTALEKSRSAIARRPSLFEAKWLEAQILQRRAQSYRDEDVDRFFRLLDEAETAVKQGLDVARSSPEGYLRLCRIRGGKLSRTVRIGDRGIDELLAQTLAACGDAVSVLPSAADAYLQHAASLLDFMDVLVWDRQVDPAPTFREVEEVLGKVVELAGGEDRLLAEVERHLGKGNVMSALYLEQHGRDPRTVMEAAVEHFEKSLEHDITDYSVAVDLGFILSNRGNYEKHRGGDPTGYFERAERHLRAAIAVEPDRVRGYAYLGQALLRRSEYQIDVGLNPIPLLDEADEVLGKAESIDPSRVSVISTLMATRLIRAHWLIKSGGDPTMALREMITLGGRVLEIYNNSAFAYLMRGQAWLGLARYAALQGRNSDSEAAAAREDYAQGMAIIPDLPGPYIELAGLALAEGRYALAVRGAPTELARRGADQARQAAELATKALSLDEERNDALRLRGEAELLSAVWRSRQQGFQDRLFERARQTLQQALEAEPEQAKNHLAMSQWILAEAEASGESDGIERGIAAAKQALRLDPHLAEALAVQGALVALDPARRDQGRRLIAEAVEKNTNLAWTWRQWLQAG